MVLEIHSRSVNYTLVARICKNFGKQVVLVLPFKAKGQYDSYKNQ